MKRILTILFPQQKFEILIFIGLFLFYLSYSINLAINTSIIDSSLYLADIYLAFDNTSIYHFGVENVTGHPFLILITKPILWIGGILSYMFGILKIKAIWVVLVCSFLTSMSAIYVYRYLTNIIELSNLKTFVLILLFAFTSTNLILSFTFESFTFSSYLLCFSVYYYSSLIKRSQEIPIGSYILISLLLGGVTITNFVKGIIPILFSKESWPGRIKKALIAISIFVAILVMIELKFNIIEDALNRYEYYSDLNEVPFIYSVINFFFGSPLLFPHIKTGIIDFHDPGTNPYTGIVLDSYSQLWQYLFIAVIFILMLISLICNRKNNLVQLIILLALVDVGLHIVMQFGVTSFFIYGGHWVYIVPLLLGWLYKSLPQNISKFYFSTTVVITLVFIVNNIYRMLEFIDIAQAFYSTRLI